jgi:hypothetical protein
MIELVAEGALEDVPTERKNFVLQILLLKNK